MDDLRRAFLTIPRDDSEPMALQAVRFHRYHHVRTGTKYQAPSRSAADDGSAVVAMSPEELALSVEHEGERDALMHPMAGATGTDRRATFYLSD
jgi:hypothetical protein